MKRFVRSTAALVLGSVALPGCTVTLPAQSSPAQSLPAQSLPAQSSPAQSSPMPSETTVRVSPPPSAVTVTVSPPASVAAGPRIVYLRVARQPKCAEGTAVFRAEPVPLTLEWKITGATGGALSVDDPTGTPGTYGPVESQGSQEFPFSCSGAVGSTETHTYALYTVGGGPVRSATVTATAKVLDKGLGQS